MPIELSPTSQGAQGSKNEAQQSVDFKIGELDNTQQQDTKKSDQVDNQQEEAKSSSDSKVATGDKETTSDEGNKKSTTDTSRDESSTTGLPGKSQPVASASKGEEAIPGTSTNPSTTRPKHTTITRPNAVEQSGSSGLVEVSVDPTVALPRTGVDEAGSKCQQSGDGDSSPTLKELLHEAFLQFRQHQVSLEQVKMSLDNLLNAIHESSLSASASQPEPTSIAPAVSEVDSLPQSSPHAPQLSSPNAPQLSSPNAPPLASYAPPPSLPHPPPPTSTTSSPTRVVWFEPTTSASSIPGSQPPARMLEHDPEPTTKVQYDSSDGQTTGPSQHKAQPNIKIKISITQTKANK